MKAYAAMLVAILSALALVTGVSAVDRKQAERRQAEYRRIHHCHEAKFPYWVLLHPGSSIVYEECDPVGWEPEPPPTWLDGAYDCHRIPPPTVEPFVADEKDRWTWESPAGTFHECLVHDEPRQEVVQTGSVNVTGSGNVTVTGNGVVAHSGSGDGIIIDGGTKYRIVDRQDFVVPETFAEASRKAHVHVHKRMRMDGVNRVEWSVQSAGLSRTEVNQDPEALKAGAEFAAQQEKAVRR